MDRSDSSFPPEEPFEDPEGFGGDMGSIPGDEFDGELDGLVSDEGVIRGWIPPDDRLWVHPSEVGRESRIQDLDGARRRARRSDRRGLFAAGVVGTAALTAAVAAVALAASSSSSITDTSPLFAHSTHLTNSVANSTLSSDITPKTQVCSDSMPPRTCKVVQRVQSSILRIVVQNGKNTSDGTAVVVPVGTETIAITAASFVGSAASVVGFDASGASRKLKVLGVDARTGIAVVKVPWAMPAASIAQESLFSGQFLLLTCAGWSATTPAPMVGEVADPDTSTTRLMDVIDVDVTKSMTPGGVLLDSEGRIIGLLAGTSSNSGDLTGEFVPAWFAVGVAKKIATQDHVHGWLDVEGTDATDGALVVSAPAQGPAATAGLKPGDLVVGLLSAGVMAPITSMSDLEGRLYLEPPGARIELEVIRGGQALTLSPVLAASIP